MCGRFSVVVNKEQVKKVFPNLIGLGEIPANYNVAPTQAVHALAQDAPNTLQQMQWGLVPYWSKDNKSGARNINARAETLLEKPTFREPIHRRRCLVIADSFYEWRLTEGGKLPFRILPKTDDLLIMAGIYDIWQGSLKSFSIITTEPNAEMATLHNRMPVILYAPDMHQKWLSAQTSISEVIALCSKPKDDLLKYYAVSSKMNNVRYREEDVHTPIEML